MGSALAREIQALETTENVIAALALSDERDEVIQRLVHFLQGSDFAGVIFSRIPIEGTFPLEAVRLNSTNPAPDLVLTPINGPGQTLTGWLTMFDLVLGSWHEQWLVARELSKRVHAPAFDVQVALANHGLVAVPAIGAVLGVVAGSIGLIGCKMLRDDVLQTPSSAVDLDVAPVVCTDCSIAFRGTSKLTFLAFRRFTCPLCARAIVSIRWGT